MAVQPPAGTTTPPNIPGPVTIRYQYRVKRYLDDGVTPGGFSAWRDYDVTNGSETREMWRQLAQNIDNPPIYSIEIHYVGPV